MIRTSQELAELALLAGVCIACSWMEPEDVLAEYNDSAHAPEDNPQLSAYATGQ